MPIEARHFRSWERFKSDFANYLPGLDDGRPYNYSNYLFRGHMDSRWPLISSFDRGAPEHLTDRAQAYARWMAFARSLYRRLGMAADSLSDLELSALAQHYGAPTRILDWSLSPYISAFFAFMDAIVLRQDERRDVAIFALDVRTFTKLVGSDFQLFTPRSDANHRVRNQLGKFLVNHTVYPDIESYAEAENPDLLQSLMKFTVPASERVKAINDLLWMGISPIEIYPDHEGVMRFVRLRQALDGFA